MRKIFIQAFLSVCMVCLLILPSLRARAEESDLPYSVSFTVQELDDLLAPIALYPDPLLAQMLPASTYPAEVADAAAWLDSGGDVWDVDDRNWDDSVKAIARYPGILQMMAGDMAWTADLGDAFLNQPQDVANAIQRLRRQARAVGNLVSNNEQSVIVEGDYIQIVPAQPQYVFIPQYDPAIVYVQEPDYGASPFVTFGPGMAIGYWLNMDFEWNLHIVIYHGWDRSGWVDHARPYIQIRSAYVDQSRHFMHRAWQHDRSHGDPARYLASQPSWLHADRHRRTGEVRGSITAQAGPAGEVFGHRQDTRAYSNSNRGRENRDSVRRRPSSLLTTVSLRKVTPVPAVSRRPPAPSPRIHKRRTQPGPRVRQPMPSAPPVASRTLPVPGAGQPMRVPLSAANHISPVPRGRQSMPVSPHVNNRGLKQPGAVRKVRPARTPSETLGGGYRGSNTTRVQSTRGRAGRQRTERVRKPTPPKSHGRASAREDASEERKQQRR